MNIEFEFSDDALEADKELVRRYWAKDADGKWEETTDALLAATEFKTVSKLLQHLDGVATVYGGADCETCGQTPRIQSRDQYHVKWPWGVKCSYCEAIKEERARLAEERYKEQIQPEIDRAENAVLDYKKLPDELALLLIALNRASGRRVEKGYFQLKDCESIVNFDQWNFVRRLRGDVIFADPRKGGKDAFLIENDEVRYYPKMVHFFLVPDVQFGTNKEGLISYLENRAIDEHGWDRLLDLWLDFAVDECFAYTARECNIDDLPLEEATRIQMEPILRDALSQYSVAEVWSIIWRSVRSASRLTNQRWFNKEKAARAIPGKLKKAVESARKGDAEVKAYDRPADVPQSVLGTVFEERFGIVDGTTPDEVSLILSSGSGNASPDNHGAQEINWPKFKISSADLFARAKADGIEDIVMFCFASQIRDGRNAEAAVDWMMENWSALLKVDQPTSSEEG